MGTGYEKFDTLVIEPDAHARMRVKGATSAVPTFGKVHQVANLTEGMEKLKNVERMDVIFLSAVYSKEETAAFIKQAKEMKSGQDGAYILVMKTQKQESSTVAQNVLVGADGVLFEPYSVDSLVEITVLAARVKGERAKSREEAAIRILVKDVIDLISVIAHLKGQKMETGKQQKALREKCGIFDTLSEEMRKLYLEIAIEEFQNAPAEVSLKNIPLYNGVSNRIKKRLEEKIVAQLKSS